MIGFRRQENNPEAIKIKEEEVEKVGIFFKCFVVVLDNKLTWEKNTDVIVDKIKIGMNFKYFIL